MGIIGDVVTYVAFLFHKDGRRVVDGGCSTERTSQKLPHNGGYALLAASKKEVDTVVHENPGVDKTVAFADILAEAIEESDLVLVVFENGRAIDPSDHDVMQGTGDV